MLNFCIFLKTKLKIYLFKLLKGAIISGACRFLAQRKQNAADLSLCVDVILRCKRATFAHLELK